MSKRSYIQRFGKQLAERDGWICHYCEKEIVPLHAHSPNPKYYYHSGFQIMDDGVKLPVWDVKPEYGEPSVDHIILRKDGGSDDLSNMVLACWTCNTERNVKPYDEYIAIAKSRPKGYPHCAGCGSWYATIQTRGKRYCAKCIAGGVHYDNP